MWRWNIAFKIYHLPAKLVCLKVQKKPYLVYFLDFRKWNKTLGSLWLQTCCTYNLKYSEHQSFSLITAWWRLFFATLRQCLFPAFSGDFSLEAHNSPHSAHICNASNLQIIIGEWKRVYKLKCTSKSALMKSYQCVPSVVWFAYKWHNILTLFGLYLRGVNIPLSALSRHCDTRKQDANWREESIFMWRLTFNYVWGIRLGGGPRNVWKQHFAQQQLWRQRRM